MNNNLLYDNKTSNLSIILYINNTQYILRGFSGGSVVKNVPANAGDMDSVPDLGRSDM